MASKALIYSVVVLAVLVAVGAFFFMQSGNDDNTGVPPDGQIDTSGEQQASEETPTVMQPSIKEFSIEADDRGFYIDGADVGSISAGSGETLKIIFNVRTTNVYYGGLQFGGCGKTMGKANPGGSVTTEFTAASTCTITSYWPSSSVVKDHLQVVVG